MSGDEGWMSGNEGWHEMGFSITVIRRNPIVLASERRVNVGIVVAKDVSRKKRRAH